MEACAKIRFLRGTARKARLVADTVRGHRVADALVRLQQGSTRHAAVDIAKLLKSAVANLQSRHADTNVDVDTLVVKDIRVDVGPVMRRFRARAQGRYGRILKRMCHISVTVSS